MKHDGILVGAGLGCGRSVDGWHASEKREGANLEHETGLVNDYTASGLIIDAADEVERCVKRELRKGKFPSLRSLRVWRIDLGRLYSLGSRCPNLTRLDMKRFGGFTSNVLNLVGEQHPAGYSPMTALSLLTNTRHPLVRRRVELADQQSAGDRHVLGRRVPYIFYNHIDPQGNAGFIICGKECRFDPANITHGRSLAINAALAVLACSQAASAWLLVWTQVAYANTAAITAATAVSRVRRDDRTHTNSSKVRCSSSPGC